MVHGDTLSPGEWAATEGGRGGGNGLGRTGLSILGTPTVYPPLFRPLITPPNVRHSPPGLAAGRHGPDGSDLATDGAALGPQELGDLN